MKINHYILLAAMTISLSQQAHADIKDSSLPDFSLYSNPTPTKESPTQQKAVKNDKDNVPSISNQDLSIKTQAIPQYVLDMMSKNKSTDFNTLANQSVAKRRQEEKEQQAKQTQQQLENEREAKEKAEMEALALQKKQKEEKEHQQKLLEDQYRVFDHRTHYDSRSIGLTDQIHKQSYGPNNQHLPVFIDNHRYSQYLFLMTIDENISAIKDLLYKGADINARDVKNHYTPLMYAVYNRKNTSVDYLLKKGADFNAQDMNGRTALHIAIINRNIEAINSLLKMKASVEIQDSEGKRAATYFPSMPDSIAMKFSPLYTNPSLALLDFSEVGKFIAIQEAIAQGADINIQDKYGNTPLILAVDHKDPQLIALLLQKNPNMQLTNEAGEDALMAAQRVGDKYIWTLLKTHIDKLAIAGDPDVMRIPASTPAPTIKTTKPMSLLPKKS